MKTLFRLFLASPLLLLAVLPSITSAYQCDQTFYGTLRVGMGYNFFDTYTNPDSFRHNIAGGTVTIDETSVGDLNLGANPGFDWTSEIVGKDYEVAPGQSLEILNSSTPYYLHAHPADPSGRLLLVYSLQVQGQNNDGSWSHPPVTHNECKYYTISWCGDGARDTSYNETCDPADPTHTGWGAGGCDTSCQPVNTASPACDSSHTGPQSSPLSVPGYCASGTPSGFSENGTNPINYSWSCVIGGFSPQQSVDCTASYTPPPPTSFDLSIKKYVNSIANDAQTQGTAVNIGTGTVFTYITRVTNNGPLIASGTTTVTDPGAIPAGITVTGVSGTGWVCSRLGNSITCTSTDSIPVTQSFPDIVISATTSTATGYFINTSTVANIGDTNPANNTDIAYIGVSIPVTVPSCSAITPSGSITSVQPNAAITYTCSAAGFVGNVANLEYNVSCGAGDANATWTGSSTRICNAPNAFSASQSVTCGVRDRTNSGVVFTGSFAGSCGVTVTTVGGGGGGGGSAFIGKKCVNNVASCATYNSIFACTGDGIPTALCYPADSTGLASCRNQSMTCSGGGGGGGGGGCGNGVLEGGEECDVVGALWCVNCKITIDTTPGANPIADLWMNIPVLSSTHIGYSWIDGQPGKIRFEDNRMVLGVGTKAFTLADTVGFGLRPRFLVPLMIEVNKEFCLASTGDALNIGKLCTVIGNDTTGLETWTRYDGTKYVIFGKGDYQIPQPDHTYVEAYANSAYSATLFRGPKIYTIPGGGSLTLNSAFWGRAVGNDGTITLSTLDSMTQTTSIDLVSLSVRVSGALVGTTGTPVNRSIENFVLQSGIHNFLSSITVDSTTTSSNTTGTSSSSIAPVNVNISSVGDIAATKLEDIPALNGNQNIRAVKGNLTINCPIGGTTFLMEGVRTILIEGNLILNCNTSYSLNDTTSSFAWIVKGGNIQVYGGTSLTASFGVTNLAGIYVAIPDGGVGGQLTPYPINTTSQKILKIEGSLYGDAAPLFRSRLYTRGTTAYEILTTGTIISYSNRALVSPPPLLSQYLNNYNVQRVIR